MSRHSTTAALAALATTTAGLAGFVLPAHAAPDGSGLVISEAYVNGGSAGASFTHKFVELYNPTDAAIDLADYSVQYRSPTGTAAATGVVALTGTLAAGDYFVVQGGSNGANGAPVPSPDQISTLNPGGAGGTLFVARATTPVDPDPADAAGSVVDLLGWGSSNRAETAPATGNSTTASYQRGTLDDVANHDSDDNAADFDAATPTPGEPASTTPTGPPQQLTIPEIQGSGAASPHVGSRVETTGVVTAAYPTGGLFGFYLQVPGSGGPIDPATHTASQGLFVYQSQSAGAVTVVPGDHVRVTGTVGEYAGATQVSVTEPTGIETLSTPAAAAVPATTAVWPREALEKEALEGMLYRPTGAFTVSSNYYGGDPGFPNAQFGEVGLAQGDRPLLQPTEVADAQTGDVAGVRAANAARAVVLDDGSSTNFAGKGDLTPPYVSQAAPVSVGAAVTFTAPVIFTEGGAPSAPTYRFQPTAPVLGPDNASSPATFENIRTAAPDRSRLEQDGAAALRVASFNVLNYFTTLGDADDDNVGDDGCTSYADRAGDGNNVRGGCDQRGAWDPQDLDRQQAKIVAAINALDADVVGLMEIENSAALGEQVDEATHSLVAALNAAAGPGTWAANPSSADLPAPAEQDVITNAIIYRPSTVERVGAAVALGDESGETGAFGNAREPIGQVFAPAGGGEPFLYVVNHFKSKGSGADDGTGQGAANPDRVRQAEALRDWVAEQQSALGVEAVLLGGDFNAYSAEDPIQVLEAAGFTNATEHFGADEWSYSFEGASGSLDHLLLNDAALERATGSDVWNINAGESLLMEYSRFNSHATDFHADNPFRSSDHDPVLVGLRAGAGGEAADSTTTLRVAPKRVRVGQRALATVRVRTAGANIPTGTVEVRAGKRVIGHAELNAAGLATIRLAAFRRVGPRQLIASYRGDAATAPSTSRPVRLTVVRSKGRHRR